MMANFNKHKKSIVLSAAVPEAESNPSALEGAAALFSKHGVNVFEYYAEPNCCKQAGEILQGAGYQGVFLAAVAQKRNHIDLCAVNKAQRRRAVDALKRLADDAYQAGAAQLLITSGYYKGEQCEKQAFANLAESLTTLLNHAKGAVEILIETGDRNVEYNQLLGPTELAVGFLKDYGFEEKIALVMDTSHLCQLGEDVEGALEMAKPYCRHVHMANCSLDKNDLLYGDKHPLFSYPNACISHRRAEEIYRRLRGMYTSQPLTVAVEIINRKDGGLDFAEAMIRETDWFFE